MSEGVTISHAAEFAHVTVKTIRHYHRIGLLPEPERDWSGYRRYGSADLLQLVTIRTLAEAGVPLAQIPALLALPAEEFTKAVADVDQALRREAEVLRQRRERLRALTKPDRGMLPAPAQGLLTRLAHLGLPEEFVAAQRESMVLAHALAPGFLDEFVQNFDRRLDDADHVALLHEAWEATRWEPDDPRLDDLAERMAQNLLAHPEHLGTLDGLSASSSPDLRYELINHHGDETLPTAGRLTQLLDRKLRDAGLPIPRAGTGPR